MTGHEKYTELMSAYIDGELDASAADEFFAHLETCAPCRSLFDLMQDVSDEMRGNMADPPASLLSGVMDAVRSGTADVPVRPKKKSHIVRYLSIAACIAIIVFVAPRLPNLGCGSKSADMAATENSTMSYDQKAFADRGLASNMYDGAYDGASYDSDVTEDAAADMDSYMYAYDDAAPESTEINDGSKSAGAMTDTDSDAVGSDIPVSPGDTEAGIVAENIANGEYYSVVTVKGAVPDSLLDLDWIFADDAIYILIPASDSDAAASELEASPECELISFELTNADSDTAVIVVLN